MKTKIYLLFIFALSFYNSFAQPQLNFSFGQQPLCGGPVTSVQTLSVTSFPLGATSYSWVTTSGTSCTNTAVGTTATINLGNCCGVYSVTCYAFDSGNMLITSLTETMSVICPTWFTYSLSPNNGSLCAGETGTITASGGASYTLGSGWPISNTNSLVVSPSLTTCYTVSAFNSAGCHVANVVCFSVTAPPTLTVNSGPGICSGNTATVNCSGANSYTWITPGSPSFSFTGGSQTVSPVSTSIYTVVGSNGLCNSSETFTVNVNPNPTVTINTNSITICQNTGTVLSATGANSYTWSSSGTGTSTSVNPSVTTCYFVTGTGSNGCISSASTCVNVIPAPILTISGSNTVCSGSSANLVTSGAVSYTWNSNIGPVSNTATFTTIPGAICTSYTVSGTDANGCIGSETLVVCADSTCSDVWPGDANSDGIVNSSDVLEIGLAFGNTGTARTPGGNAFISQYATNWVGLVSSGKNKCHADCNGDGIIDLDDTLAIFNNFSLTHPFRPSGASASNEIAIVADNNTAYIGQWNKADVILGSSTAPINQVYGITFDLAIDQTLLDANSVYFVYTASFLNQNNQNVEFKKSDLANDKIYAASVRTDHTNTNGFGKIGEIWFKVKSNVPNNSVLNLSISNAGQIDNTGSGTTLNTKHAALNISANTVGIKEVDALNRYISMYPNPASKQVNIKSAAPAVVNYSIYDVVGREIKKGGFDSSVSIDVSELSNGTYIIYFESGSLQSYQKLVISNH